MVFYIDMMTNVMTNILILFVMNDDECEGEHAPRRVQQDYILYVLMKIFTIRMSFFS